MPSQCRKVLANGVLNDLYAETVDVTAERLDQVPGKITIGIDGHVDGRGRSVHTVSLCKQGIAAFSRCTYLGSHRHTGTVLAQVVEDVIKENPGKIVAIVADNTGNNMTMFQEFQEKEEYKHFFFIGCGVHIPDLLIEDICKIPQIAENLADVHFMVSFTKRHKLLREEFWILRDVHQVKCADLKLFSETRFAYAYLMSRSVLEAFLLFGFLLNTSIFKESVAAAARRGNEGRHAQAEFARFKKLTNNFNDFKGLVEAIVVLLEPFSLALHYLEGDEVPASHSKPIYSVLLQHSKSLPQLVKDQLSEATLQAVIDYVEDRWLPPDGSRKVGMKNDVIQAAFAIDPYAQAVMPDGLLTNDVTVARDRAFTRLAKGDPQLEACFSTNLLMFQSTSNTVFEKPLEAAESLAKKRMESALSQLFEVDPSSRDNIMKKTIATLKSLPSPSIFWGALFKETGQAWNAEQKQSHQAFCSTANVLLSIVTHSCATERFGKGYKLIHTFTRTSLLENRLNRLMFVYFNYPLCRGPSYRAAPSFRDFLRNMLSPDEQDEIQVCLSQISNLKLVPWPLPISGMPTAFFCLCVSL